MKRMAFVVVMGVLLLPVFSGIGSAHERERVSGHFQIQLGSVFFGGGVPGIYYNPPVRVLPPQPVIVVPPRPWKHHLHRGHHRHHQRHHIRHQRHHDRWDHDRPKKQHRRFGSPEGRHYR